jgi:Putative zinc-finger
MWPGPDGCDEIRHALGAYVVGAIDPAERTVVERHIAACPACRDELAGLAGLPALLGRLTLAEVEDLGRGGESPPVAAGAAAEPPAALLRSILDEAARRRAHRRRAAVLAVAASAVVLAGAGTAARAWLSGSGAPAARPSHTSAAAGWQRQVTATDPRTNVTAIVRFSAARWGTAVDASVNGVSYGTRCELWATDYTGKRVGIASWTYASYGAWYPASSSVAAHAIKSFEVTAGGHTLVAVPVS